MKYLLVFLIIREWIYIAMGLFYSWSSRIAAAYFTIGACAIVCFAFISNVIFVYEVMMQLIQISLNWTAQDSFTIFIRMSAQVRKPRSISRGTQKEIINRIKRDSGDFYFSIPFALSWAPPEKGKNRTWHSNLFFFIPVFFRENEIYLRFPLVSRHFQFSQDTNLRI